MPSTLMVDATTDDILLTLKEAALKLRISKSTMYRRMEEGHIVGYKIGPCWRFYLRDVQRLLKPTTYHHERRSA